MHRSTTNPMRYTIGSEVTRHGGQRVLHARRQQDGARVLLVLGQDGSDDTAHTLEQERALMGGLPPTAILPVLALEWVDDRPALVLDHLLTGQSAILPERSLVRVQLAVAEQQRLDELLTEVLQYARDRELAVAPVNLNALLLETIAALDGLPADQVSHIHYDSPVVPCLIDGDADKLRQVLINLLTNACQAIASHECVDVLLSVDPANQGVRLDVRNPGQIPEDMLARLTEPFFSTKAHGTGLGLAIVDQIVTAHGGTLEIRCALGDGVRVSALFPAKSGQVESDPTLVSV